MRMIGRGARVAADELTAVLALAAELLVLVVVLFFGPLALAVWTAPATFGRVLELGL